MHAAAHECDADNHDYSADNAHQLNAVRTGFLSEIHSAARDREGAGARRHPGELSVLHTDRRQTTDRG